MFDATTEYDLYLYDYDFVLWFNKTPNMDHNYCILLSLMW